MNEKLPPTPYPLHPNSGFTLVELLIVISMLALFTTFSGVLFGKTQARNNLAIAGMTATNLLHRAQILSRTNYRNSGWGVNIAAGNITLYKGSSFALRDASYDEVVEIVTSIGVSGTTEFNFTPTTGAYTGSPTPLTLTAGQPAEFRVISVNAKGAVI